MTSEEGGGGGISFAGLLAILFIGLKLGKVIDWSWWWVLCPLWIPFTIAIIAIVIYAIICRKSLPEDRKFRKFKR